MAQMTRFGRAPGGFSQWFFLRAVLGGLSVEKEGWEQRKEDLRVLGQALESEEKINKRGSKNYDIDGF